MHENVMPIASYNAAIALNTAGIVTTLVHCREISQNRPKTASFAQISRQ